jgi:hypothetical protein
MLIALAEEYIKSMNQLCNFKIQPIAIKQELKAAYSNMTCKDFSHLHFFKF